MTPDITAEQLAMWAIAGNDMLPMNQLPRTFHDLHARVTQAICQHAKKLREESDRLMAEVVHLRSAIGRAGFTVMETSGEWSIHDTSEHAKAEEQRTADVVAANIDLEAEVSRLRREIQAAGNLDFDWSVIERLDRLEELQSENGRLRVENARLTAANGHLQQELVMRPER